MSVSVAELAEIHGWRREEKLNFVSRTDDIVTLRKPTGDLVTVKNDVYRDMISTGYARKPGLEADLDFILRCRLV